MGNYLIYALMSSDSDVVRYIGMTNNIESRVMNHLRDAKRTKVDTHKKKWILSVLNRNQSLKYEILFDGLSQSEAFQKEKEFIYLFKHLGANLVNGTKGGDGVVPTEETIAKIKKNRKPYTWTELQKEQQRNRLIGRKLSQETKNKMSASQKRIGNKPPVNIEKLRERMKGKAIFKGRKHSEESKLLISSKKKGVPSKNRKPVVQINKITKEVVKIYESLSAAIQETGVNNIHRCISKKRKTAGGYEWDYK